MNIANELKNIDQFFDSLSDDEFFSMLEECGINRIKSTKEIFAEEESIAGFVKTRYRIRKRTGISDNYNDGIDRSIVA